MCTACGLSNLVSPYEARVWCSAQDLPLIKKIVEALLQKAPQLRPSASELLKSKLIPLQIEDEYMETALEVPYDDLCDITPACTLHGAHMALMTGDSVMTGECTGGHSAKLSLSRTADGGALRCASG